MKIPWGSSPDEINERLSDAGLPPLHDLAGAGAKGFTGRLLGANITGVANFTPDDQLVRLAITFNEAPGNGGNRYDEVRKILVNRYGEPVTEGDAVSVFESEDVPPSETATLQLVDEEHVALIYESPGWNAATKSADE